MHDVIKVRMGQSVRVGLTDGDLGEGKIAAIANNEIQLCCRWLTSPPLPLPLTLALAVPRPPVLRRVIQQATSLGIKRIALFRSARVEKSYLSSSALHPEDLRMQCQLGLEQSVDTKFPEITTHPKFHTFVQNELPAFAANSTKIAAHPTENSLMQTQHVGPSPYTLLIGPEGGLLDNELLALRNLGFSTYCLGPRILRVETAVTALISKLAL